MTGFRYKLNTRTKFCHFQQLHSGSRQLKRILSMFNIIITPLFKYSSTLSFLSQNNNDY